MVKKKLHNLIGAHVSGQGGFDKAAARAHEIGCECYQFFTRSPQGGNASVITPEVVAVFKAANKKFGIPRTYVHAPYFINLTSEVGKIWHGSVSILREELARCSSLGVTGLMTHIGSAHEMPETDAVAKVAKAVVEILKDYKGSTKFLLEVSAGAGNVMGAKLEQIGAIITLAEKSLKKGSVGVCLDTAHLFASGYDVRTGSEVSKVAALVKKHIGWARVMVVHSNDSKVDLGARKDRHEHIGKGKIGMAGFRAIMANKDFNGVDFILETPEEDERPNDIKILKKLRGVRGA